MRRTLLIVLLTLASASFAYAQAVQQAAGSSDEQWIRDLERRLGDGITRMDREDVAKIMADDFISVGSNGDVTNKEQTLDTMRPYPNVKISFQIEDTDVRLYEGTTAIVMGRDTLILETKERRAVIDYRFTRVYIKKQGRWQLVTQQVTQLPSK